MERHENESDEAQIQVTVAEVYLISNLIHASIHNIKIANQLNDQSRKMAQDFMVKLQRSALSIKQQSKQPTH